MPVQHGKSTSTEGSPQEHAQQVRLYESHRDTPTGRNGLFLLRTRAKAERIPVWQTTRHACELVCEAKHLSRQRLDTRADHRTLTCATQPCYDVTRFGRDDECAGCCHPSFKRMTIVCRQRGIRRKICPRDQSLRQVRERELSQPLQHKLCPSLVPIHK